MISRLIDFTIPGDLQPEVTFSVIGASGTGLTPDEVEPEPAVLDAVNVRFMLTYIPGGEENKVNYHVNASRVRVTSGGEYTDMGDGVWMYKFATVLPEDYEMDATYTLASVAPVGISRRFLGVWPRALLRQRRLQLRAVGRRRADAARYRGHRDLQQLP